ncbi:PssE/Cps14G family polysaccharide biosynthesis glycosyltransferase [Jeotgalibaca porci]|uniref:PssE/Cps14G family polysaccharide biosynthesis glycosyltransferase n=1 Tax=Jeotgalibaca porci TaxID=1868793 RepID=UPI003F8E21A7
MLYIGELFIRKDTGRIMIFVTLGSQKFQFDRLLEKIDKLIEEKVITEKVFAQTGNSNYQPNNYEYQTFMDRTLFLNYMNEASIVITHAGTGAIITALKVGKKVIAVPRRKNHGEHVDNHQLEIVHEFDSMNLVEACYEVDELKEAFEKVWVNDYATYQSNTENIINSITLYLESNL